MNKIHWIRDDLKREHPRRIITHCGKEGWHETGDEFTCVGGFIFDAAEGIDRVKCGRCLKSYARIENSPWGCKR